MDIPDLLLSNVFSSSEMKLDKLYSLRFCDTVEVGVVVRQLLHLKKFKPNVAKQPTFAHNFSGQSPLKSVESMLFGEDLGSYTGLFATYGGSPKEAETLKVSEYYTFRGSVCEFGAKGIKLVSTLTHAKVLYYPDVRLIIFTTANGLSSNTDGAVLLTANSHEAEGLWTWFGKSGECPPLCVRPGSTARVLTDVEWVKLFEDLAGDLKEDRRMEFDDFYDLMKSISEASLSLEWVRGAVVSGNNPNKP